MNSIPWLTTPLADDMLEATRKLEEVTDETWGVDWEQLCLRCLHGVRVPLANALKLATVDLWMEVAVRHDAASRARLN